jgi:hypothetical protein
MQITGVTKGQFEDAVRKAGILYNDNLKAEFGTEYSPRRFRARVVLKMTGYKMGLDVEELAPGQRRSGNVLAGQRRVNAVCWHAYRDVLVELFNAHPDVKVRTGMAKYIGKEGFYENFPGTAHHNIGSQMYPVTMPQCCDC